MTHSTDVTSRCGSDHCITCSDEGVPMRVDSVDAAIGLARCIDGDGQPSDVMIALVADVNVGDTLLVHAGTALTRLQARGSETA